MWLPRAIRMQPRPRGFHLVTGEVLEAVPEPQEISVGVLHHRHRGSPRSVVATAWGEGRGAP